MGVEMGSFFMKKEDGVVRGMFELMNYENTLVRYELKAGRVLFEFPYWFKGRTKKRYMPFYKKWYENEKELYEKFILMYANEIEAKLNIPINCEKEVTDSEVLLKGFVKEETTKRMWEPFRSKTKYKLRLLHMLR